MTVQTRHELAHWLDILGCPYCHSPLRPDAENLVCTDGGHPFPMLAGIPSFVRQEDRSRLTAFSRQYREARMSEDWRPLTADESLALPFGSPPGYLPLYWEVRRQSYRALVRLLAHAGPSPQAGPAADLGAGTGWLAYRLAQVGYRVLAIEASLDADFGLQAAGVYRVSVPERLLPVQGDLEHPPLLREQVSLAILNASLHYAHDLEGTIQKTADALRPGGCLIVLDTPVARHPRPGTGMGDRHLGRQELWEALLRARLQPRWIRVSRWGRWWVHQVKAWAKGDKRFSFPIVRACKAECRQVRDTGQML
jgi:SAM-dependent methyltransferase